MNAAMQLTVCQILAANQSEPQVKQRRVAATYASKKHCPRCGSFIRYTSNRNCMKCHQASSRGRYKPKG